MNQLLDQVRECLTILETERKERFEVMEESEAMEFLKEPSKSNMAYYRRNGLRYLKMRPVKYLRTDLEEFLLTKRQ